MRQFHSFGADPVRDAQIRTVASRGAEKILSKIQKDLKRPAVIDEIARTGEYNFALELDEKDFKSLGLPTPAWISIMLAGEDHYSLRGEKDVQAAWDPRLHSIALFTLPPKPHLYVQVRRGRREIHKVFSKYSRSLKQSLLHEVVHYIDYLRGNDTMASLVEKQAILNEKLSKEEAYIAYINTPHEFNAFFQQGLAETWHLLITQKRHDRARTMASFDKFLALALRTPAFTELSKSLDKRFAKKMLSRLAQTFTYWNEIGTWR